MKLLAVACLTMVNCAQLLGLDNTKLEQTDAGTDASSVCDAVPESCAGTTGRSACGQVFGTGPDAGARFTVAAPTGAVCDGTSTEGPCALAVSGMPLQSLFDGNSTGEVIGQMDDCGRFVVNDIDSTATDVAIKLTDAGGLYQPTVTLKLARTAEVGQDTGIAAYAVLVTTTTEWATQLGIDPANTSTGYLVKYTSSTGMALANEAVAVDSGSPLMSPPGTIPWAAYFTGAAEFGTLDPAATVTAESGTAFAGMPAGPFSLEGFRQGRRCKRENLRTVGNTLIHVLEDDC